MDILLSIISTLIVTMTIPIFVYGLFVKFGGIKEPEKKVSFMVSVLVQKIGTAFGFVVLFVMGKEYFNVNWLEYGLVWAAMFAIVEIGQAIGPDYSKKEAIAGIVSEFIYFPVAAVIMAKMIL